MKIPATSGIEIDLHLTLDNKIILQHDEDLDRMTVGGTGRVADHPWKGYIDQLKTKGDDNEPVALLHQVLKFLLQLERRPSPIVLVLDVKDDQSLSILDELKLLLEEFSNWKEKIKIYLGVWRHDFALQVRQVFPASDPIILTLIADFVDIETVRSSLYDAFNLDVDGIGEDIVREAGKLGKDVLLWTCNKKEQIEKAKELKVQGILTDNPLLIQ